MPSVVTTLSRRSESMKQTIDELKETIDNLPAGDKDKLRRNLGNKRDYNKNYSGVAKKVENHIKRHGHITNKEAFERGYTSKLLDTTTFSRCIISKLSIQVGKKRLPDRRIAFYDTDRGAPSSFSDVDQELVDDIMTKIDMRFRQHNLRAVMEDQQYPAMKRKGSLGKIRPLLIASMASRGYTVVGNELIFVRGE